MSFVGQIVMIKSCRACNILAVICLHMMEFAVSRTEKFILWAFLDSLSRCVWMKQLFVKFNFKIMNYDNIFCFMSFCF